MLRLTDFYNRRAGHLAMFQDAIAKAKGNTGGRYYVQQSIRVPADEFKLDGPLECWSDNKAIAPPSLVCDGQAVLRYTGPNTDEYFFRQGGLNGFYYINLCEGIRFECHNLCRGVYVDYAAYGSTMNRVSVAHSMGCAFHIKRCIGASFRNLYAQAVHGSAFHGDIFSSTELTNFKVSNYDDGWVDDIPQAVFSINGGLGTITGLCFEGIQCGDKPVVQISGQQHRFDGVRFEGVEATGTLIEITDNVRACEIDRIMIVLRQSEAKTAVTFGRRSHDNTISNVIGRGLSESVGRIMGPDTYNNRILEPHTVYGLEGPDAVPLMIDPFGQDVD